MRFVFIIMLLVILAISFSGCKGELTTNKADSKRPTNSASNTQEEVIIKASYEKPLSLTNKNTIFLDGLLKGEEYIEVIVKGEIFDFEQIALIWDENKNESKEKETVKRIEKLANQTIVIKTYQPEGIPSEKIKWKSRTGKAYEYIICESSLGDTDNSIIKFRMDEKTNP